MRGPEPSDQTEIKTESIRAVTTLSQSKQDPECRPTLPCENLWSSEEDKIRIRAHQENDSNLTVIIRAVETGQKPCHNEIVTLSPAARYYWSTWDFLVMHEGCLYRQLYREMALAHTFSSWFPNL